MPYAREKLDYPVDIGTYKHPRDPNKPICLHMTCSPLVFAAQDGVDFEGMVDKNNRKSWKKQTIYNEL